MVNDDTLRHMCQLLLHEPESITSDVRITSDAELLLGFVLNVCMIFIQVVCLY